MLKKTMAETREITREMLERDFEVSKITLAGREVQYANLKKDPSCVLIIEEYKNGVYRLTECQEGEYGIGIIGRSNQR